MSKRKITLALTAVALVALMIVGATLAWFTDTDTVTNVITIGNVKIDLFETDSEGEKTDDGLTFDVIPGAEFAKDPTVENIGANDAYLRLKVEIVYPTNNEYSEAQKEAVAALVAGIDYNTTDFTLIGGYFYYNGIFEVDDVVTLFEEVAIPSAWGNDMMGVSFNLKIVAEAIQSDNLPGIAVPFTATSLADAWALAIA